MIGRQPRSSSPQPLDLYRSCVRQRGLDSLCGARGSGCPVRREPPSTQYGGSSPPLHLNSHRGCDKAADGDGLPPRLADCRAICAFACGSTALISGNGRTGNGIHRCRPPRSEDLPPTPSETALPAGEGSRGLTAPNVLVPGGVLAHAEEVGGNPVLRDTALWKTSLARQRRPTHPQVMMLECRTIATGPTAR